MLSPVDQETVPAEVAVNTELPQLSATTTDGADGMAFTVNGRELAADVPQLLDAVTEIVPELLPVVKVIVVVPCPAVIVEPEGTVHV